MADESLDSIIEDLRDLGVNVGAILDCNPTSKQLLDMRNGLLKLSEVTKVVRKYRAFENRTSTVFVRE